MASALEDFTRVLMSAVNRLFRENGSFDPMHKGFETVHRDLDGKDLAMWRDYIKACGAVGDKVAEVQKCVSGAMRLRERFWKSMMGKFKPIEEAFEASRPLVMCRDKDGQIVVAAGPLDKRKKPDRND
jgi:hypothetical protein